jgi:adenosylcobinamide-GDP ribazoletransferase
MSANDVQDNAVAPDGEDTGEPSAAPGLATLLIVAAGFLTRLPLPALPADPPLPPDALARAMSCFPLVGAAIGTAGGLVLLLAGWLGIPVSVAVLMAHAAIVWLTGALHEDGLADVADGFGGGADRDAKLAIMRDSRIGSYGVLALVAGFALKAAALIAIAQAAGAWVAIAALVAAAAWSRAVFAPLMRWLPPARADGVAAGAGMPTADAAWRGLVLGAALALLVSMSAAGGGAVIALAAGGLAAFVTGWLALDHVGGYTGDVLGAAQQAAEIATLIALGAAVTGGWV